jgi:V-type H+-transporting ATPase subunit C
MVYWLVSLPLGGKRRDAVWEYLQEVTSSSSLSTNFKLELPSDLRISNLDALMSLSDELSKTTQMMDVVVTKIKRQVIETAGSGALAGLKVEGVATDVYVQRFKWDEAKFPARRPLKEAVEKMTEVVGRIEDDLKVG